MDPWTITLLTAILALVALTGLGLLKVLKGAREAGGLRQRLESEIERRVRAETQLQEAQRNLEEQRQLVEEAEKKLSDTFEALSSKALRANSEAFAQQAAALVQPLGDSLQKYERHIRELEAKREGAYAGIQEQVKALTSAEQQLQRETSNLVTALRNPQVRGRWGEVTLRRVIELAGMSDHCDYTEQVTVQTDDGRLRPDLVVHLPAGRTIVVDSKVSLDAYLSAVSAESEEERERLLADHTRQVRDHIKKLSQKVYWSQFDQAPEFVVMFIPGECFFSAAMECDRTLIEDAAEKRVVLATPTTLIALLRSVVYGWRQESIAESAREVSELGKQLYDRLRVFCDHLVDVAGGLKKATESYNKAVGSLESRVLPAARRFEDLKIAGGAELPSVPPVESSPRSLSAPDAAPEEEPDAGEEE